MDGGAGQAVGAEMTVCVWDGGGRLRRINLLVSFMWLSLRYPAG